MPLVWYFAYGSNMQRATFTGRRGIEPRRAVAARVDGWRIVFDKPTVLPSRHGVANLVRADAEPVLGVLYEITADDLAHVHLTEGVLIGSYERLTIEATPLDDGAAPVAAHTLFSSRRAATLAPSRSYMALLIEGALEHGLPAWYVDRLRAVPAAEDSAEDLALRAQVDEALRAMRRGDPR